MNEKGTESLVRAALTAVGYYEDDAIVVEEQISDFPKIKKLLKNASKKGDGAGYPEFIITSQHWPDLLIVVECKADVKKHKSKNLDNYKDYAVDGALLYASYLSKEFDVISLGVSGQTDSEMRVSHYLTLKAGSNHIALDVDKILPLADYFDVYIKHPAKFRKDYNALIHYSQILNKTLHTRKVKESQRSLLISAILIALQNNAFVGGYKGHKTAKQLATNLVNTVVNELDETGIPPEKIDTLKYAYGFIETHAVLSVDKQFLIELIGEIDKELNDFMRTHAYFDALGQFYIEFLRYANNDKGLGIVLTPPHITELYSELACVDDASIVFDNCCGTSGFLISAMSRMIRRAKGDSKKVDSILNKQLVGIEFQDDIYALAVSNMILHGDGKTSVYHGDCFKHSTGIKEKYQPTIGFLNPPYKSEKEDLEELEFVLNNLECLVMNGTCIAIVPISCLIATEGPNLELKRRILEAHTLEAVMSMPSDLFHNSKVAVVTCTAVFTANKPHPKGKKTWFALWRDDGYMKIKNKGRIDANGSWPATQAMWVSTYLNREVKTSYSVMQEVGHEDEWCAEAYLATDYSDVSDSIFEAEIRKYLSFSILDN